MCIANDLAIFIYLKLWLHFFKSNSFIITSSASIVFQVFLLDIIRDTLQKN